MSESGHKDVTLILQSAGSDGVVSDDLFPLVYDELRKLAAAQMAKETPGQTLQPTALVHEVYLRLVGDADIHWHSRGQFFGAAANSMRQLLINRAKRRKTEKHGGEYKRVKFDEAFLVDEPPPERLLALDEALSRLDRIDPRKAKIVMLKYFAGLSIADAAKAMDLSPATVKREWRFARAWLQREASDADA